MDQTFTKLYQEPGPLIEAVGITKTYKDYGHMNTAVTDVSLKINAGDFVIIFGPSPSGKTTLLAMLYGLEKPDIGEVLIKGEPYYEFSENERNFIRSRKFGFVPQTPKWFKYFNVLDNVALPLLILGEQESVAKQKAYDALRYFGIEKYYNARPLTLNFVDQQLASIARSTINNPWLIFVDEPYTSLDIKSAEKIVAILQRINKEKGIALIVAANNPEYLKYSRIWFFINDGQLEDVTENKNPIKRLKEIVRIVEEENSNFKKHEKNFNI